MMAYRFDAAPTALAAERRAQFMALGIPANIIDGVASRHGEELWDDELRSWVREWSAEAATAEAPGDLLLASLCFGVAKYPCVASQAHGIAYGEQLRTYLAAAPGFRCALTGTH
jgi:esterase FrsA